MGISDVKMKTSQKLGPTPPKNSKLWLDILEINQIYLFGGDFVLEKAVKPKKCLFNWASYASYSTYTSSVFS